MKNRYLIFFALAFFGLFTNLQSQSIQNGNFENWTTVEAFQDPSGMQTFNEGVYFSIQSGNTTPDSSSHSGNLCARLETKSLGGIAITGLASIGLFDGVTGTGGIPYTHKPDSAFIWVKYNIVPGDTAAVGVFFKKMGNLYGIGFQFLTGAINGWTKIELPIAYGININPDSLIFMATSSIRETGIIAGSVLYVDDLSFSNGAPSIPNAGFESWVASTFEQADSWYTYSYVNMYLPSPMVEKTTDAYSGTYAIKVKTQLINLDTLGYFSNADIRYKWNNGQPVSQNPYKLTGYYKYTPVGNDTAIVGLQTHRWDPLQNKEILVEENMIKLPPTSTYMPFEVMLSYNHYPKVDTLQIAFASSNLVNGQANVNAGSELIVDSLNLLYFPVGIEENNHESALVNVFPNPASNQVNFQFDGAMEQGKKRILIFDAQSKKMIELETEQELITTDISQLSAGLYFYIVEVGQKLYQGKFSVR